MRKYAVIAGVLVLAAVAVFWIMSVRVAKTPGSGSGVPPLTTGVRGTILLGPTCPVERVPPMPGCADKPYATAIAVYPAGSESPYVIGNSDASGAFGFALPPGSYTLAAAGGTTLPRCPEVDVTVPASGYATTTVFCDTGIR
ncbi:MAG: hypothetical protein ACYC75_00430 [Minisyncoccota bacterium]